MMNLISSWFFLLMIDGLIEMLDKSATGACVCDLHIPSVILADDTSLISNTPSGLQKQLDIVYNYARRWHLRYNPNKSCILFFSSSRKRQKQPADRPFILGQENINLHSENVYAGVVLTDRLRNDTAITQACRKGKRILNSLINIGVHDQGIHPMTSVKLWKTVVMPSILYGCELWDVISKKSIEELEVVQRYAARRMQGFDQRSPTLCTIFSLGLVEMKRSIDKIKLMFWNRLCTSSYSLFYKKLFIARLCSFGSTTPRPKRGSLADIHSIMREYNIDFFFREYL